jgi:EAL domain-containing protein (putative c-di-GMP-specific phosphodiesterase class I)
MISRPGSPRSAPSRGLPIDGLKIDRSFIRNLDSSESARAITASIIDISHHLRLTVIADGVETQEQWVLLGAMGFDQAQGFLFSQGLPLMNSGDSWPGTSGKPHRQALADQASRRHSPQSHDRNSPGTILVRERHA